MKHKLSKLVASILVALGLGLTPLVTSTAPVFADDPVCSLETVSQAVKDAYGCPNSNQGTADDFSNTLQGILNGIIGTLGIVAVIVVIIGGVMYMTSNGDAGKLQKAKSTILYATIGLIISVLSFAIVNFVILNIIGGQGRESVTSDDSSLEATSE